MNENETVATGTENVEAEATVDYAKEYETLKAEAERLKKSINKLTSENADYKRKERERMSGDEQAAAEKAENDKRYAELEAELRFRDGIDEYMSVYKMDKATATAVAQAERDGDKDKVRSLISKHITALEKAAADTAINGVGKPFAGNERTPEKSGAISYAERSATGRNVLNTEALHKFGGF